MSMLNGRFYNFSTYATGYLGTQFNNVKIEGTMDYDSVSKLNLVDPIVAHQAIYPSLPPGVPNNPKDYYYYKVKLANGTETAVGIPWVDESTIVELTTNTYRFTTPNLTPEQLINVRAQLAAIGVTILNAEVVQ